ncbi:maltodextrin glucosidase [Vibrio sp. WXL210]|uniref:maltodextrin glucosidase n=1 Tax=Vibrio sp. WXL210 TaxID=3450709 RepID=UPI003EC582B1
MSLPFIFHAQSADWSALCERTLTLTLVTERGQDWQKVLIRHEPDNEEQFETMSLVRQTDRLCFWQGSFELRHDRALNNYVFKLLTTGQQYWLSALGVSKRMPGLETHFKINPDHQPPTWVHQQVFYQIFPDRFNNAKPEISVRDDQFDLGDSTKRVVSKAWGAPVETHSGNGGCEFYGGDLYGVEDKLDYLQQLGVTALYLNPIFNARSNHGYDTTDYFNIAPHLGTNADFAKLCEDIHGRKMKIVLDAVFNHTSTEHPWFNKLGQHPQIGAYQSPTSDYRDYYFFAEDSNQYIGWNGIDTLPVLNFENSAVRDIIYQSEESIIKHWLKAPYRIDGWRFDVIHMLGEGEGAKNNAHYVKAFRESAKQVNPETYILGEHFFEASGWLQGEQEDGAMNYYGFAHPLRALLANKDIALDPISINMLEFRDWLAEARAKLPWDNQLAQLNQLDSHDTPRFFSLISESEPLLTIAATLLFTYVGTPCLYYGTEIGMAGGADPDNRRCMEWERVNSSSLLPMFKQLIALRQSHPALQRGALVELYCDAECWVFARQLEQDVVLVGVNLSQHTKAINLTAPQQALLGIDKTELQIAPVSAVIQ